MSLDAALPDLIPAMLPLSPSDLVYVTQGVNNVSRKATAQDVANLGKAGPTGPAGPSWTVTDNTNTVANVTNLTVFGIEVGGATPNATLNFMGQNPGISFTGTASAAFQFQITPSVAFYLNGGFVPYLGPSITDSSSNNEPNLLTLTISNVKAASSNPIPSASIMTSVSLPVLEYIFASVNSSLPSLVSLDLDNLIAVSSGFGPSFSALTGFSFPSLQTVGGSFSPADNSGSTLLTLSVPVLTMVGSDFNPSFPALTAVNVVSLTTVGGNFSPVFSVLSSISLPSLSLVSRDFSPDLSAMVSVSLPSLVGVGGLLPLLTSATSFLVPALARIGTDGLSINSGVLPTFSLPVIVTILGTVNITSAPVLANFSMGATLKNIGGDFFLVGAALTQASVDGILVQLAGLNGTGGTTSYDNHTVDLSGGTSSTPSATGAAAVVVLQGRGNTVTTN